MKRRTRPALSTPWLFSAIALSVIAVAWSVLPAAAAFEVWVADQSDTGKETGGFLYVHDGAQLAADPNAAQPTATLDLCGDINALCENATKKSVRRPHMIFFNHDQSHAIVSFLSGQVLFLDAATRKPDACLSVGKNVHAGWPTPDQRMAIGATIAEKKFIRVATRRASILAGAGPRLPSPTRRARVDCHARPITPDRHHEDGDNGKGSTPGVMVIQVADNGKGGRVVGIARISNRKDSKETADPRGITLRKNERDPNRRSTEDGRRVPGRRGPADLR